MSGSRHSEGNAGASRFQTDTAVVALGAGRYQARIDPGWWIVMGPNGGYIAAIVARAIEAEAGAPDRHLHSLTLHYLRPPAEGDVEVHVAIERVGRTVTSLTARLIQGDKLIVLATAALATPREALEFTEVVVPSVPAPEDLPTPERNDAVPEMTHRYAMRPCVGSYRTFAPGDAPAPAVSGGWIRFDEPTPMDAVGLVAVTDAWFPPIFHRYPGRMMAVPTVDLTIHVLRLPDDPLDWVLVEFDSPEAAGGYLIENGKIWDRAGNLLAMSRQLAVVM